MISDAEVVKLLREVIAARGRGDVREVVRILRAVIARIEGQGSGRVK